MKQIVTLVVLLLAASSLFASTFVVTNGNDSGAGSLRQAVADANANPGPDSITMSLPAPYVVQLSSTITITDSVMLDGTVSGGMAEIRGASTAVDGLTCTGGASTITRLIASGFANAIRLQSSGNTIDSCWIGGIGGRTANADGIRVESSASATMITNNVIAGNTNGVESLAGITAGANLVGLDPSGASAVPNTYGLYLRGGSNLIGGSSGRNVISGNSSGIRTDPFGLVNMSATITGNYIGLDITGSRAVANTAGIYAAQLTAFTIGGTAPTDGNVISGNGAGIQLNGGSATIQGNTIGLNAAATAKLANTTGISLFHCIATIGGTASGAGNIISGNGTAITSSGSAQPVTIQGNWIGTDASGRDLGNSGDGYYAGDFHNVVLGGAASGAPNVIAFNGGIGIHADPRPGFTASIRNSIYRNAGGGIIRTDHPHPTLTSATTAPSGTEVQGTADAGTLEFFANPPGEAPQGHTFIGSAAHGGGTFTVMLPPVPAGQSITATQTANADTSEFSNAVVPTAAATADLYASIAAPSSAEAGATITYTITIANLGVTAAANVTISTAVPAGTTFESLTRSGAALSCSTPAPGAAGAVTCTSASLAAGATASLSLVVRTSTAATVSNTVSIASDTAESNPSNNVSTVTTQVSTPADRADTLVTLTAPPVAAAGTTASLAWTVGNGGPSDASSVDFALTLPSSLVFLDVSQDSGTFATCTTPPIGSTGAVRCSAAHLLAGTELTFKVHVRVLPQTAPGTGAVIDTTVVTGTNDPDASNNRATQRIVVTPAASVRRHAAGHY